MEDKTDVNQIPILPYITVSGDDNFSGKYVYVSFSNKKSTYIYKHQTKDLFMFKDIFGLILADSFPNDDFDNYKCYISI